MSLVKGIHHVSMKCSSTEEYEAGHTVRCEQ